MDRARPASAAVTGPISTTSAAPSEPLAASDRQPRPIVRGRPGPGRLDEQRGHHQLGGGQVTLVADHGHEAQLLSPHRITAVGPRNDVGQQRLRPGIGRVEPQPAGRDRLASSMSASASNRFRLYRVISSWALADNASASPGKSVASAFANKARAPDSALADPRLDRQCRHQPAERAWAGRPSRAWAATSAAAACSAASTEPVHRTHSTGAIALVHAPGGHHPLAALASNRRDEVEVAVVVQNADLQRLGRRCHQEVRDLASALTALGQ